MFNYLLFYFVFDVAAFMRASSVVVWVEFKDNHETSVSISMGLFYGSLRFLGVLFELRLFNS